MRQPFPLQWPTGWARTTTREQSRFTLGLTAAVDDLFLELERLGAANRVITSDLPTRRDGRPYASGRAEDPGIAVWFVLDGQERVFACDRWLTPSENVRAISSTIAALRGMARWGATDMIARALSGFNALPAGEPVPTVRHWSEVLGVTADVDLATATRAYRTLSKAGHPDTECDSASTEVQIELNRAIAQRRIEEASCWQSMRCLCAAHARGAKPTEPCNATEEA